MSATPLPSRRSIVALKNPRRVPDLIVYAKKVVTAMTGNPSFPTPNPPLATVESDISELDVAEAAVLTRTKGASANRNVKLAIVRSDMEKLKAYVQETADTNPGTAESVIQSAGMSVKKITLHDKAELSVLPGVLPGSVHLVAKAAAHRAAYEWQYSLDGKTWTSLPATLQAKTVAEGLTSATNYSFRVRPVTKGGEGAWSQIISALVA